MKVLVLNAGSSSQKCCLYDLDGDHLPENPAKPLWEAHTDGKSLKVSTAAGGRLEEELADSSSDSALMRLLETLWSGPTQVIGSAEEIDIVGHRIVHGGTLFRSPTRITEKVKNEIRRLVPLAPAHNPVALLGMEVVEKLLGDVAQIAVFDTAFHQSLPDVAAIYPGPYEWSEQGIRRFGFHGINHQYCSQRAARLLGRDLEDLRLISCHLGNGCSLAAIRGGKSVDTTMGFTPMDGLMMGTRSGSIDPGILLYLQREKGLDTSQLDHILNKESGLKGISGLSGDMRDICEAMARRHERARLAFDMYVHHLCSGIGSMLAVLGGMDALIFTAGIGEHSAELRSAVCEAFAFLGVKISLELNESKPVDQDIALMESAVRVLVIQAQEDWAIAQECYRSRNGDEIELT